MNLRWRVFEAAADLEHLESPEDFLGYTRTQGFASPGGVIPNKQVVYSLPGQLKLNQWALAGEWIMEKESVRVTSGHGTIRYSFHARDLNLIMGPAKPGSSIKFRILINGSAPGSAHGLDVDSNGYGMVNEQRMYQLVRQQGPVIDQEFEIEFLDPDAEVYDFTFG